MRDGIRFFINFVTINLYNSMVGATYGDGEDSVVSGTDIAGDGLGAAGD